MAAGLALVAVLSAAPAQAQRDRVFVASYGSDSNPCTFGSPCKTFQQAIDVVAQGGEVTAIDSAGFGTIFITRAVTITSPNGVEAGIAAPGTDGIAITIDAQPSDVIILNGLTLDGASATASYGIQFNTGGELHVQNCAIRKFSYGIGFSPSASSTLSVSNTLVSNNAYGIQITGNAGTVAAGLNHVDIENAGYTGLFVGNTSAANMNINVDDTTVANSGDDGIEAQTGANPINIVVRNSTIANNGTQNLENYNIGLSASGSGAQGWVTRSTITGNPVGLYAFNNAAVFSYGDNNFVNNVSSNRASSIVGYQ
jgi:hypothetical protein